MATPQRAASGNGGGAGRTMGNPLVAWVRRLSDPLASANHAQRWIAELPAGDVLVIQKEALELVAGFPGSRRDVGPAQVEALLRIDSRLELFW